MKLANLIVLLAMRVFSKPKQARSIWLSSDLFTMYETTKIEVLTYRENYGGEIANKRWLKQF